MDLASDKEIGPAQKFYDECGYGGSRIKKGDIVVLAKDANALIGVARLCPEESYWSIRGMQVVNERRGVGIGQAMLRRLVIEIGDVYCYCLPYEHLEHFYGTVKFEKVSAELLPMVLQIRYEDYLKRGMRVIAMRRSPAI